VSCFGATRDVDPRHHRADAPRRLRRQGREGKEGKGELLIGIEGARSRLVRTILLIEG